MKTKHFPATIARFNNFPAYLLSDAMFAAPSSRFAISANPVFGSHTVNKRRRGAEESGLYEYQLIVRVS